MTFPGPIVSYVVWSFALGFYGDAGGDRGVHVFTACLEVCFLVVSYVLGVRADASIYSITVDSDKRIVFGRRSRANPGRTIGLNIFISRTLSFLSSRNLPLRTITMDYNPNSCAKLHVNIDVTGNVYCNHKIGLVTMPALRLVTIPMLLNRRPRRRSTLVMPVLSTHHVRICTRILSHSLGIIHPVRTSVISTRACGRCLSKRRMCFFKGNTTGYVRAVGRPRTRLIRNVRPLTGGVTPLTRGEFMRNGFRSITCFMPFCLGSFITGVPGGLV